MGKDLQKLKQYQADRERKEVEDEREENKKAKEKIREQIARDR